mgnify:CR=1 FL=1
MRGLLRRVRADGGLLAPYAVSVCLISLALCSGPTLLNQMSDDGIRAAVRDEPIVRSALVATTQQRLRMGEGARAHVARDFPESGMIDGFERAASAVSTLRRGGRRR